MGGPERVVRGCAADPKMARLAGQCKSASRLLQTTSASRKFT